MTNASSPVVLPYRYLKERVDHDCLVLASNFQAATLYEAAGKRGALPTALKPLESNMEVCGPAITVKAAPGDNLWIHRALAMAEPGDILVVDTCGFYEAGYWGEVMNVSAMARHLGGLVINGCVRDGRQLVAAGFPVFARGLCLRGTSKQPDAPGFVNETLVLGDVVVEPGDLIRGDCDGVVSLPRTEAAAILKLAQEREDKEAISTERLRQGETTLDIKGWR